MISKIAFRLWKVLPGFLFVRIYKAPITFVTASDSSHEKSLFQLLESLKNKEPNQRIVVFDMGLSREAIARLQLHQQIELHTFDFSAYPKYFNLKIGAGQYAWKPIIVRQVSESTGAGFLIWLDSGNVINEKLRLVRRAIARSKVWSPKSSGLLIDWTYPELLNRFALSKQDLFSLERNGAIIGFDLNKPRSRQFIQLWAMSALDQSVIAPQGSSRTNHRQDQATLTLLMRVMKIKPFPDQNCEIATHQDLD